MSNYLDSQIIGMIIAISIMIPIGIIFIMTWKYHNCITSYDDSVIRNCQDCQKHRFRTCSLHKEISKVT